MKNTSDWVYIKDKPYADKMEKICITSNVIPISICKDIIFGCEYDSDRKEKLTVMDDSKDNPKTDSRYDPEIRKAVGILPENPSGISAISLKVLSDLMFHYGKDILNKFYNMDLKNSELEILKYSVGGHYKAHVDSRYFCKIQNKWVEFADREISVILFLNEDFEGGELYFPEFGYQIKPKTGMAIAWPSDENYFHQANSVISGTRYAVVAWYN